MGAENRVGLFLAYSGYELHNPCRLNLSEHWHCATKMHKRASISNVAWQKDQALDRFIPVPNTDFFLTVRRKLGKVRVMCHTRGTVIRAMSRLSDCV
jgi:hypothetical protein